MKRQVPTILIFLALVYSLGSDQLRSENQGERRTDLSGKAILSGLIEKQGEDLRDFVIFLDYELDKSHLTDHEIDRIVERLLKIQESDQYQKVIKGKGGTYKAFPNRYAVPQCVYRFRFQKIANALRALPIEVRVRKIVEGIENPPTDLGGWDSTISFSKELVRAGKEAVPFIIQLKPKAPYHRRAVLLALAEIRDLRGIDYIIEVLRTRENLFRGERPIAAEALAAFNHEAVIQALIEALQDETFESCVKNPSQQASPIMSHPGPKPSVYLGRYYSVQHEAAESLSALTGKNWGLLYNEDHDTWLEWLRQGKSSEFSPARVPRSNTQLARLIEFLFRRYMCAQPMGGQPQDALATMDGLQRLSADLKQLGKRVIPVLVDQYAARVREQPIWKRDLQQWTKGVLVSLGWAEAKQAAENLD